MVDYEKFTDQEHNKGCMESNTMKISEIQSHELPKRSVTNFLF